MGVLKVNGFQGTVLQPVQSIENSYNDRKSIYLKNIAQEDSCLEEKYKHILQVDKNLTRRLVSFQANKTRQSFRWYKFKEGFSASLVEYLINEFPTKEKSKLLDPFAGSGSALFVASEQGIPSVGIELLPIGQEIIRSRQIMAFKLVPQDRERLEFWLKHRHWQNINPTIVLSELNITKDAYPEETTLEIRKVLTQALDEDENLQTIIKFAVLCVLESVSYTRKDGQYLRWDARSGRRNGLSSFNKGIIGNFSQIFCAKLKEISEDIFSKKEINLLVPLSLRGSITLLQGSCLQILPSLESNQFDYVITSPPYCNRYDYTRTYALELALLGVSENELKELRQNMLSCTVENRVKDLLSINPIWDTAIQITKNQVLLQSILIYLNEQKKEGSLNNNGIPRMVSGYFYEMACVIFELYRVVKHGGVVCMVNDNVRYAGTNIPVDLILSDIAKNIGFHLEKILVLPNGKGNSSQQMGTHGRNELRKCVYIWKKI